MRMEAETDTLEAAVDVCDENWVEFCSWPIFGLFNGDVWKHLFTHRFLSTDKERPPDRNESRFSWLNVGSHHNKSPELPQRAGSFPEGRLRVYPWRRLSQGSCTTGSMLLQILHLVSISLGHPNNEPQIGEFQVNQTLTFVGRERNWLWGNTNWSSAWV